MMNTMNRGTLLDPYYRASWISEWSAEGDRGIRWIARAMTDLENVAKMDAARDRQPDPALRAAVKDLHRAMLQLVAR
jgi:hypothetical protein